MKTVPSQERRIHTCSHPGVPDVLQKYTLSNLATVDKPETVLGFKVTITQQKKSL